MSGRLGILMLCVAQAASAYTCLVTATPTVFGVYSPFAGTSLDTTATVTVTCVTVTVATVNYNVQLSTGGAGSYSRYMAFGGAHLNYNLYTDAARTLIWGNGTAGTSQQSYSGSLPALGMGSQNYTVYARIATAQNNVSTGAYVDSIVVTVNY